MSVPPPDYFTARTIGTGQSNPGDVRRLRSTLKRTGHGRFPGQGAPNVTPGLMEAIKRFQTDFGLEPDAVIRPGGPTERALSMALRARNWQGPAAMEALRDTFAQRSRAGLAFRPHPRDRNAGQWVDATGRALTDAQAAFAARPGQQLAMMRSEERFRRPHQNLLEGGRGYVPRGSLHLFRPSDGMEGKEAADGLPIMKPRGAGRTVPLKNPDFRTPPSPAQPPGKMKNSEEFPAEERHPTVTVSPVPEERRPQIEIFPDQSNIIEQWIVVENSRGLPDLQQKDLQYIIDGLYRRLEKRGLLKHYKHTAGGYTAANSDMAGEYMKERTVLPKQGGRVGSHRPDFSYRFDDSWEDINVVDTLKDNATPTARERRALAGLIANKKARDETGATRTVGKSKGMSWDEYTAAADHFLDIIVDEMERRIRDRYGDR